MERYDTRAARRNTSDDDVIIGEGDHTHNFKLTLKMRVEDLEEQVHQLYELISEFLKNVRPLPPLFFVNAYRSASKIWLKPKKRSFATLSSGH